MSSSVKRFELFRMLFAIAIALLVSFGIIFLVSSQPLTAIYTLITGPFKSRRNFANVIEAMIPLIFTGTGVCIMFSANQINLAGEGAFHIGGLVSAVVALELGLSAGLSQAVAILLSGLAGAVFTAVPAVLKIKTNSSVLVSSLMLNYLAQWFATFILMHFICDPSIGSGSYLIPEELKLPAMIEKTRIHAGLIIALAAAVLGYFFLYRSRTGYELRLTGQNELFARYSGVSIVKVVLVSQLLGGFIAGVGGAAWSCSVRFIHGFRGLRCLAMAGMQSLSAHWQRITHSIHHWLHCFWRICVPVRQSCRGIQMSHLRSCRSHRESSSCSS